MDVRHFPLYAPGGDAAADRFVGLTTMVPAPLALESLGGTSCALSRVTSLVWLVSAGMVEHAASSKASATEANNDGLRFFS